MACDNECKMCKCVKKGLKEVKEGKTTSYKNVKEMKKDIFKERDEWIKKHPKLYKIEQTYYSIERFFIKIIDFFRYDIGIFIQRGRKGWSNRDWWNYPFHISTITVGCLKKLKKDGHTLPTWKTGKSEKQAVKEWNDILDNIIYTFEMVIKIEDGDVDYIPTTRKNAEKGRRIYRKIYREINKEYPNLPKNRVLTERESKKLEKGFDLYKKWFFSLWD